MRNGDRVEIKMQKALCKGITVDEIVYQGTLLQYNEREESLYVLVNSSDLTMFSLDAIYFCEIQTGTQRLQCTGRIKERCCHKMGKLLIIEIENGFYKINIKSVDK